MKPGLDADKLSVFVAHLLLVWIWAIQVTLLLLLLLLLFLINYQPFFNLTSASELIWIAAALQLVSLLKAQELIPLPQSASLYYGNKLALYKVLPVITMQSTGSSCWTTWPQSSVRPGQSFTSANLQVWYSRNTVQLDSIISVGYLTGSVLRNTALLEYS